MSMLPKMMENRERSLAGRPREEALDLVNGITPSPYEAYIKTLMECFPDEVVKLPELDTRVQDVLYSYQNRNARILINKLEKMGTAILADSVGLGKTITAGAVIDHYLNTGKKRITIIVPAALKNQWQEDLKTVFNLKKDAEYQIVSQQDLNLIRKNAKNDTMIDLFVIDEAHNLRNESSERYQCVLEWLQNNPESRVLMLTATPINNSLNDLANLIQLGLKGALDSILVPFREKQTGRIRTIDFFEALNNIQRAKKRAEKRGERFEWDSYRPTLASGISRYLVRSTRQGVEAEGALIAKDGTAKHFPKSEVINIKYSYPDVIVRKIADKIDDTVNVLDGIDVRRINIETMTEETQRTQHPWDFAAQYLMKKRIADVIPNMFQLITLIGFVPYRTEIYKNDFYDKTPNEIKKSVSKNADTKIVNLQLAIHNVLQVTWLKRLESSAYALQKSVKKYQAKLTEFIQNLNGGYILSCNDVGEDLLDNVTKQRADAEIYNIEQLLKDAQRDQEICKLMSECLEMLTAKQDAKMKSFVKGMKKYLSTEKYGKKVLVFSFFADTINYLRNNLQHTLDENDEILERAEFISGQTTQVDHITKRFSPKSKKYHFKKGEKEIDLLFATDVLSEGQNLQDAAILINYDLHWNPVRMIQRNGRINRLGSSFEKVLISNMIPENKIELYLKIVARLESKISTIKNSVGLDQGVLDNSDVNPIEFIEDAKNLYSADKKVATATMANLNTDNDILSWTNEHVFILRNYLNSHADAEIKRIKNIPVGKWTYLPNTSKLDSKYVISLQKVIGNTAITGQPIAQTFFLRSDASNYPYATEMIEDQEALDFIRAEVEDDQRKIDEIKVDRQAIAKRTINTARRRAENSNQKFVLKPSMEEAIELIQAKGFGRETAVRAIIEQNLKDAKHKRQFEKLVRQIRQENREEGFVEQQTIQNFNNLINELVARKYEQTMIDRVEDVLYYIKEDKK